MSYNFESLIDDFSMLKMIVREEIELVQKVADVNTAQWIHLRERKYTREPEVCQC